MKIKFLIILMLVQSSLVLTSCYDEPEDEFGFEPATKFTFSNPSGNWTSIDNVILEMAANGISSATVVGYSEDEVINLGTIQLEDGVGMLNTSWSELKKSVRLEITAINPPNNAPFTTRYPLSKTSAITVKAPQKVKNEEAYDIELTVNTVQTPLSNVKVYEKIGEDDYQLLLDETVTGKAYSHVFEMETPSEEMLNYQSSLHYRIEVTSTAGLTEVKTLEIPVVPTPLPDEGNVTLNTEETDAFSISLLQLNREENIASERRDLVLKKNGNTLEIEASNQSGTTFVIADDEFKFSDASYQLARDAFEAGSPITTITDLANRPVGTVFIVKVGVLEDFEKYAVVRVASVVTSGETSGVVSIQYKANLEETE